MPRIKLSDVFDRAADECLLVGERISVFDGRAEFSCDAVSAAIHGLNGFSNRENSVRRRARQGMSEMGCPVESLDAYDDVHPAQRQDARYLWLKWCALMAREQGD